MANQIETRKHFSYMEPYEDCLHAMEPIKVTLSEAEYTNMLALTPALTPDGDKVKVPPLVEIKALSTKTPLAIHEMNPHPQAFITATAIDEETGWLTRYDLFHKKPSLLKRLGLISSQHEVQLDGYKAYLKPYEDRV